MILVEFYECAGSFNIDSLTGQLHTGEKSPIKILKIDMKYLGLNFTSVEYFTIMVFKAT